VPKTIEFYFKQCSIIGLASGVIAAAIEAIAVRIAIVITAQGGRTAVLHRGISGLAGCGDSCIRRAGLAGLGKRRLRRLRLLIGTVSNVFRGGAMLSYHPKVGYLLRKSAIYH
jgi:hypothetical protein